MPLQSHLDNLLDLPHKAFDMVEVTATQLYHRYPVRTMAVGTYITTTALAWLQYGMFNWVYETPEICERYAPRSTERPYYGTILGGYDPTIVVPSGTYHDSIAEFLNYVRAPFHGLCSYMETPLSLLWFVIVMVIAVVFGARVLHCSLQFRRNDPENRQMMENYVHLFMHNEPDPKYVTTQHRLKRRAILAISLGAITAIYMAANLLLIMAYVVDQLRILHI